MWGKWPRTILFSGGQSTGYYVDREGETVDRESGWQGGE